ncbi:FUSC family membrane protein [Algoriella sp.]|uniref:FUSC family membrane protein n=1 Tax=Algoriella sp. TaxID=1872434 RepID=UPI002FCC27F7
MKLKNTIENFIFGEALADGLKTSLAIVIPPLIASFFDDLHAGVTISLGAILAHMTDTPGPFKERRNLMWLSVILIFVVSFFTKSINSFPIILGICLTIIVFLSNMLTVWGQRTSALGMVVMMTMVMNMNDLRAEFSPFHIALFVSAGAVWYTIFSLAISTFRPYRMAQQNLADAMIHISEYIRIKASMFDKDSEYDDIIKKLIDEHVVINEKQNLVRELVFTNKKLVKDQTPIGRSIVFIFSDLIDIFENITANQYDYKKIREVYGDTKAMRKIYNMMNKIAHELKMIAYHINSNKKPKQPTFDFEVELKKIDDAIKELYAEGKKPIVLTKIYINLKQIVYKIEFIHKFFYDDSFTEKKKNPLDHVEHFQPTVDYSIRKLRDHLNLKSPIFRHALRSSIVMILAYGVTFIIPMTYHSYWILMTVLVILKPGFSVTKKRNLQRLKGTIGGGLIGILILLIIPQHSIRFVLMLFFMLMAYTFIRQKYAIGTFYLTAYILISFSFYSEKDSIYIIQERLVDTLIGGFMAFISCYIIFPTWEKNSMNEYIQKALIADYEFIFLIFKKLADNDVSTTDYKLARKDVFIAMANINSVFQRVISEPKGKQENAKELNKFTIFNQSFVSYSVGLVKIIKKNNSVILTSEHIRLMKKILQLLLQNIRLYGEYETDHLMKTIQFQEKTIAYTEIETEALQNESELIEDLLEYLYEIVYDFTKVGHVFVTDEPLKDTKIT